MSEGAYQKYSDAEDPQPSAEEIVRGLVEKGKVAERKLENYSYAMSPCNKPLEEFREELRQAIAAALKWLEGRE